MTQLLSNPVLKGHSRPSPQTIPPPVGVGAPFTPQTYRYIIKSTSESLMIVCESFVSLIVFELDAKTLPGARFTSSPLLWWTDEDHITPADQPSTMSVQRISDTVVGLENCYMWPSWIYCTLSFMVPDANGAVSSIKLFDPTICNVSLPPVTPTGTGGPPSGEPTDL